MSKTWVYSDPHFYHQNICKFTNFDGSPVRPWDDATTMTEEMIQWYNELVDDKDRVYILGDVAFSNRNMHQAVERLNGRKVLVPGNHEPVKMKKYFDLFDDVRGYVVKKGFIMSHMPIHEQSMGRWELNIHGHLHNNFVTKEYINGYETPKDETYNSLNETIMDKRYYNACVERTNFRPKLLDEILHERGLK
jgi:calcineurin-like phosphoesterase family protein